MRKFKILIILANIFLISSASASDYTIKTIFNKCASCHGTKAEKKALGVSDVIANWSAQKIEKALLEYKDGVRNAHNGSYGGLMKGQVKSLSPEDIKEIAKYISSLKNK